VVSVVIRTHTYFVFMFGRFRRAAPNRRNDPCGMASFVSDSAGREAADDSDLEGDGDPEDMDGPAPKRAKKTGGGDGEAKEMDDEFPPVIQGGDGEYPRLPAEHHAQYQEEGNNPRTQDCYWGGARHIEGSEEWQRLKVAPIEFTWKSSMSANFRVVENHACNTARHFYHAGPHMSMVFDISQQNSPDTGDKTIKTICFMAQLVNTSPDLRGCIMKTHFTALDINTSKGKGVRGLYWHGGRETGGANPARTVAQILPVSFLDAVLGCPGLF
jgi:hypothetical protein